MNLSDHIRLIEDIKLQPLDTELYAIHYDFDKWEWVANYDGNVREFDDFDKAYQFLSSQIPTMELSKFYYKYRWC